MSKEIEAKFLEIDKNDLIKKIKSLGGKKIHPLMVYKRYVFLLQDKSKVGYARIRQENNKVTMTVKTYDASKFANESEVELNNTLEDARKFMLNAGFQQKSYQETLREKWKISGCPEIAIDTLPGIPTYVELECKSEAVIKKVAKQLDLDYTKAEFGGYDKQFVSYYGLTAEEFNNQVSSLTFKNVINDLKPFIKKNNDLLKDVFKVNMTIYNKAKNK
jgi:adenylate cyclase class IV